MFADRAQPAPHGAEAARAPAGRARRATATEMAVNFGASIHPIAIGALMLAVGCALVIVVDLLAGHRQHMTIMNVVWPITAFYAGPLALWGYFTIGRLSTRAALERAGSARTQSPAQPKPMWQVVALATTHCGAGCTLGDLVAEWLVVVVPITLFGQPIFGAWLVDFTFAFAFGIAFQYFTIAPAKHLTWRNGLAAALKADTLSLMSWQVGMYGWMAIVFFAILGHELPKTDPTFWFMMQIAMLVGFLAVPRPSSLARRLDRPAQVEPPANRASRLSDTQSTPKSRREDQAVEVAPAGTSRALRFREAVDPT